MTKVNDCFLGLLLCVSLLLIGCGEEAPQMADDFGWAPPPQAESAPPLVDRKASEPLIISEFMAVNDSTLTDAEGRFADWIEIHNYGEKAVELEGWALTDDANDLTKWRFSEVSLAPGAYLVVFASGETMEAVGEVHCSFQLRGDGEYLALVSPEGRVVHEFAPTFPKQRNDLSYGIAPEWDSDLTLIDFEGFLEAPTPGQSNRGILIGQVEPVQFDLEAGVRDLGKSLNLSCSTRGANIFFTLDGSIPTEKAGTLYQEPISLSRDVVVRARAYLARHQKSRIKTRSYFVRGASVTPERPDVARSRLPIVSLALDPNEFKSIYHGEEVKGRDGERVVNVEWFDERRTGQERVLGGLRVLRSDSPEVEPAKHSFRLYFRDEYGPARWRADLFGPGSAPEVDRLELRAINSQGLSSAVWNRLFQELTGAAGEPFVRGHFCHLYINGHYWGLYELAERPDLDFVARYFGGRKSSFDILAGVSKSDATSGDEWFELKEGNQDAWTGLLSGITGGASTKELPVERSNVIRHMLLRGLLAGNAEQATAEWWAVRNRDRKDGFRWMWPKSLPLPTAEANGVSRWWGGSGLDRLWGNLISDPEFLLAIRDQIHQWSQPEGLLVSHSLVKRVTEYQERLSVATAADRQRWPGSKGVNAVQLAERLRGRVGALNLAWKELGFVHSLKAAEWRFEKGAAGGVTQIQLSCEKGEMVYSMDGTDPRAVGGGVDLTAVIYTGPISITGPTVVTVRTRDGLNWGPIGQRQIGMGPKAL